MYFISVLWTECVAYFIEISARELSLFNTVLRVLANVILLLLARVMNSVECNFIKIASYRDMVV